MNSRTSLLTKWPELLALASLCLIGFFVWDRFIQLKYPVVHMSCFAYRDVNRNGVYDAEDRPYGGLKVRMERPKGRQVEQESNAAGFANFDMSLGSWKAEITRPGEYILHAEAPQDWYVTSSNQSQTLTIRRRDAAAVGLIAERTIDPVGVAPRLTISGRVPISGDAASTIVKVHGPDGHESTITVTNEGFYSLPAIRGMWNLESASTNGAIVTRNVWVDRYSVVLSRMSADATAFAPKPKLKIIGFDNLTTSDTLLEIPNGYEGLNWRNWVATHQKFYESNTLVNVTISGEYFAYTSSGHPATISSSTMFDFVGAYVGMAWSGGEKHDIVVRGWRQEKEVYHDWFRATTAGPVYFDADYRSITRVEFASEGYWQVPIDDVVVRVE